MDAHVDPRVRPAHRTQLRRAEFLPVGRAPPDHLAAELGLAVAVEDADTEPLVERACVRGRQRSRHAAHVAQRRERRDRGILQEHDHGRGWQHRRPDLVLRNQPRELIGNELLHQHDGNAEPEREQHLVDARPERERHRHEVGHARPFTGLPAAQRTDHAVEQLDHRGVAQRHRLRPPRGARRELDDRLVVRRRGTGRPGRRRRTIRVAGSSTALSPIDRVARSRSAAGTRGLSGDEGARPRSTPRTTPRSSPARSAPSTPTAQPSRSSARKRSVRSLTSARSSARVVRAPPRYTTGSAGSPSSNPASCGADGPPFTGRSRRAAAGRRPGVGGRSASG